MGASSFKPHFARIRQASNLGILSGVKHELHHTRDGGPSVGVVAWGIVILGPDEFKVDACTIAVPSVQIFLRFSNKKLLNAR